jgi:hypothetical protein
LPPAWAIFAIWAGSGRSETFRTPLKLLCGIVPLAQLLICWPAFADSHQVYMDLEPLLPQIEIGSSVICLNLGPQSPNRLYSPVPAAGHIVATRGGRALFDYTLSPISPVTQHTDKQWVDAVDRLDGNPMGLRPDFDLRHFRYVLINTRHAGLPAVIALAMKDEARLVQTSGTWTLFESKLPLVPIDSPEVYLPEPHPATLRKRIREVAKELEEAVPEHVAPAEP